MIVIGAPRSGTTLMTELLEGLGVFMGWRQDPNREASLFLRADAELMRRMGASWDRPEPLRCSFADRARRAKAVALARRRLRGPWAVLYLGPGRLLARTPARLGGPWGWKDPRSTFTLPVWLELLPAARVVHVVRHGIDVAAGYVTGPRIGVAGIERPWAIRPRRRQQSMSLLDGLELWDAYVEEASRHASELGPRAHTVRFETLCAHPAAAIEGLAAFLGAEGEPGRVSALAELVEGTRALAHAHNPRLMAAAEPHAELLGRHGYAPGRSGAGPIRNR